MLFDPEELFGSVEQCKVLVVGDFTSKNKVTVDEQKVISGSEFVLTGASRAAQALADLGFQVSVCGLVNEDAHFLDLQEALFSSKIDVSGLKTGLGLPSSVSTEYVSASGKSLFSVSRSVRSGIFTSEYRSEFQRCLFGKDLVIFAETAFQSLDIFTLLSCTNMAREFGVKTAVIPYARKEFKENSKYFLVDYIIGSESQIYDLALSCKVIMPSDLFSMHEIRSTKELLCSDLGEIISYGNGFWVGTEDISKAKTEGLDPFAAPAICIALRSLGYRFDQCVRLAARVDSSARDVKSLVYES